MKKTLNKNDITELYSAPILEPEENLSQSKETKENFDLVRQGGKPPEFEVVLDLVNGQSFIEGLSITRLNLVSARGVATRIAQLGHIGEPLISLDGRQDGYFLLTLRHSGIQYEEGPGIRVVVTLGDLYVAGIINNNNEYFHFGDVDQQFRNIQGFRTAGLLYRSGNYNHLIGNGNLHINWAAVSNMYQSLLNFSSSSNSSGTQNRNLVILITLISESLRFYRVTSLMVGVLEADSFNSINWAERIRPTVTNWGGITRTFWDNSYPFDAIRWVFILAFYANKPNG
ncbi:ribosome-inactivating family protein [Spiroplasma endosymbiont of Panorpa germanica]|uniref:ribosome-inactivating family protein n=1 Tax=Spiroplasma endosymbiont of Panorpa germanica TaxID=3066314 RepID=UPI0030CCCE41